MAAKIDRSAMAEQLQQRTEENFSKREGERKFAGYFKPDMQIPLWSAGKGEHLINIIPYVVGENDPRLDEGTFTYVLNIDVHRNIGPRDQSFPCLEQWKQACPVCQERNRLLKQSVPDSDRAKKAHEDRLKSLRASRRVVYNVEVLDSDEEQVKGVQVWEVAHYLMERELLAAAKRPKKKGGGYTLFADPERGKSIWFERTGVGATNTKYEGHKFEDREYVVDESLLDAVFTLDDLLHIPTYEEVSEAFWDEPAGSKEVDPLPDDEQAGADQEEKVVTPPPRRRSTPPAEDEKPTEESAPRRRIAAPPAEEPEDAVSDAPAPSRRNPQAREIETDGDPTPTPAARRSPAKVGTAKPLGAPKCPVPGGKYGVEAGSYEECETCVVYDGCLALKSQSKQATAKPKTPARR